MPWKMLGPLLQIVNKLMEWFEQHKREQNYKERQEKRDEAAKNPRDAFDLHFSGRMLADDKPDATKANKTNTGNNGKSS